MLGGAGRGGVLSMSQASGRLRLLLTLLLLLGSLGWLAFLWRRGGHGHTAAARAPRYNRRQPPDPNANPNPHQQPPADANTKPHQQPPPAAGEDKVAIGKIKLKKVRAEAVVPRIVHYILSDRHRPLNFTHLLCIKSVALRLKPDAIYIHNVTSQRALSGVWPGRYRGLLEEISPLLLYKALSDTAAGRQTDAVKLNILTRYGGVYLSWDMLALRALPEDWWRYEVTVSWPHRGLISDAVLLSAPGAYVLSKLLQETESAGGSLISGRLTELMTSGRPDLMITGWRFHRVTFRLGTDPGLFHDVHLDGVHYLDSYYMLSLHGDKLARYVRRGVVRAYNDTNIKALATTAGRLARHVWYGDDTMNSQT